LGLAKVCNLMACTYDLTNTRDSSYRTPLLGWVEGWLYELALGESNLLTLTFDCM
jgi:hypothetical protein